VRLVSAGAQRELRELFAAARSVPARRWRLPRRWSRSSALWQS